MIKKCLLFMLYMLFVGCATSPNYPNHIRKYEEQRPPKKIIIQGTYSSAAECYDRIPKDSRGYATANCTVNVDYRSGNCSITCYEK